MRIESVKLIKLHDYGEEGTEQFTCSATYFGSFLIEQIEVAATYYKLYGRYYLFGATWSELKLVGGAAEVPAPIRAEICRLQAELQEHSAIQ